MESAGSVVMGLRGGEMLLQAASEHLAALLWWWLRRMRLNPKTMPTTTRTVTMKMKIFVAFPT